MTSDTPTWLDLHPEYGHWLGKPSDVLYYTPMAAGLPDIGPIPTVAVTLREVIAVATRNRLARECGAEREEEPWT